MTFKIAHACNIFHSEELSQLKRRFEFSCLENGYMLHFNELLMNFGKISIFGERYARATLQEHTMHLLSRDLNTASAKRAINLT